SPAVDPQILDHPEADKVPLQVGVLQLTQLRQNLLLPGSVDRRGHDSSRSSWPHPRPPDQTGCRSSNPTDSVVFYSNGDYSAGLRSSITTRTLHKLTTDTVRVVIELLIILEEPRAPTTRRANAGRQFND